MFERSRQVFRDILNFATASSHEKALIDPRLYRGATQGRVLPADALIGIKGLRVFSSMRIDDQIKSAMMLKKCAVLASSWEIQPASESPEDILKAEFIEFAFEQMDGSITQSLYRVLTGLDYGFSISELNWRMSDIDPFRGKIVLKNIKTKHPDDFEFEIDIFGNVPPMGLVQKSTNENLPIDKFIHFVNDSDFGSVYGTSDLRAAHKAWFSKSVVTKAWGIYLERFAMPTPVALYTQRAKQSQQNTLSTILDRLQFKSSIVMPKDMVEELKFLEATGRGGDTFEQAVTYFDRSIVRSLLVPDQMGIGGKESGGSFAKAKTHFNVFMLAVQKIQEDLAESVMKEQVIKRLIDFNFAETRAYPSFVFLPLEDDNRQEIAKIWTAAVQGGVVQQDLEDRNTFRQLLGFPEKDEEEGVEEPEEDIPADDPEDITEEPPEGKDSVEEQPTDQIEIGTIKRTLSINNSDEEVQKFTLSRAPTKYEEKENFAELDKEMVRTESELLTTVREIMVRQRDDLIKVVSNKQRKGEFDLAFINNLTLRFNNEIRSSFKDTLIETYEGAKKTGRALFASPLLEPLPPAKALKFFQAKAFYITGLIDEDVKRRSKSLLYNSVKQGWSVKETTKALAGLYEPYLGDAAKLRDSKLVEPFRLETIVRTNTNEALNQGRKDSFAEEVEAGFIIAYQYSAILDSRTTEICEFLDEKMLDPSDPRTDKLIPPNHFNCRSVIVPVTRDEGPVTFISESEIGRALDLKAANF